MISSSLSAPEPTPANSSALSNEELSIAETLTALAAAAANMTTAMNRNARRTPKKNQTTVISERDAQASSQRRRSLRSVAKGARTEEFFDSDIDSDDIQVVVPSSILPTTSRKRTHDEIEVDEEIERTDDLNAVGRPLKRSYAQVSADLSKALQDMPLERVEEELAKYRSKDDPSMTMLEALQGTSGGGSRAEAAKQVLDGLADSSLKTAFQTALAWRYISGHALWSDHQNPALRNDQAFLASLDNGDIVKINIVIGTSTEAARQASLKHIKDSSWPTNWFDSAPRTFWDDDVKSAGDLSKRMLLAIAATAQSGISYDDVVGLWEQSISERRDPTRRRLNNSRLPTTSKLLPMDILARLRSHHNNPHDDDRAIADIFPSEKAPDRLELKDLRPTQETGRDTVAAREKSGSRDGTSKENVSQNRGKGKGRGKGKRVGMVKEKNSALTSEHVAEDVQEGEEDVSEERYDDPDCRAWHVTALITASIADIEQYTQAHNMCETCAALIEETIEALARKARQQIQVVVDSTCKQVVEEGGEGGAGAE